jgi:hypothetical protein
MQLKTNRTTAQHRVAPLVALTPLAPNDHVTTTIAVASELLKEKLFGQIPLGKASQEVAVPGDLPEA